MERGRIRNLHMSARYTQTSRLPGLYEGIGTLINPTRPKAKCKRVRCRRQAQLNGLCATHFKSAYHISVPEYRRRNAATLPLEKKRGSNKILASYKVLADFNIPNKEIMSLYQVSEDYVLDRRRAIVKEVLGESSDFEISNENIHKVLDALKEYNF